MRPTVPITELFRKRPSCGTGEDALAGAAASSSTRVLPDTVTRPLALRSIVSAIANSPRNTGTRLSPSWR